MTAEYLITLRRIKKEQEEKRQSYDKNDINDQSPEGADLLSLKSFCRTTTQNPRPLSPRHSRPSKAGAPTTFRWIGGSRPSKMAAVF